MDYSDRACFEKCAQTIASAMSNRPSVPYPPPPLDLTPIADAIREGLQSIGTAIEYAAQIQKPKPIEWTDEQVIAFVRKADQMEKDGKVPPEFLT